MAGIQAFRAYRYDLGRAGNLSDVVCPPYDVIDAKLQQSLYDRSPYNVIRLEFNQPQPGDSETSNSYTRAAAQPLCLSPGISSRRPAIHPKGILRSRPTGAIRQRPDLRA